MINSNDFIKWEKDNIENKDSLLLKILRENGFISVVGFKGNKYTIDLYQGKINFNPPTKSFKEVTPTYRVVIDFVNELGFPSEFSYTCRVNVGLFYDKFLLDFKNVDKSKNIVPAILSMLGLLNVYELEEEKIKIDSLIGEEVF